MKAAQRLTKEIPEYEHLSEKIGNSFPSISSKIDELTKDNGKSFMTLCHGDLWLNNIMYAYDQDGSLNDALLCDFQGPSRGPAVLDVINHLYCSSMEDIKDRGWDILVQHYHEELSTTLKKLNYPRKIPTLTDIQIEILEKGACFMGEILICPGCRVLESTGQDVSVFTGESLDANEQNYRIMANPKCRKMVEFIIDFLDRKGHFE